jgi:branched-chain amino acid transport system substrate-binding protein
MSPASTNPKLTQNGIDTLFRITGRDDRQGTFAGPWLAQHFAGKKVAILDDGSAYGRQVAVETARAMEAAGLQPAIRAQYSPTSGNYAALIGDLAAAQIDAVYLGGYHDSIGVFVRQTREKGFNAQILGADALNTMEFVTIAGTASDGTMFTNAAELRDVPAAKPVVARFRSDGWEPEGYTLSAYAAIEVWAQAVRKAGTTDTAAVAAALRDNTWQTSIGEVDFDETGDLTNAAYTWYRFQNGTYREAGNLL